MDMKAFYVEVVSMQRQLNSYFEIPDHPKAQSLVEGFQKLEYEVQVEKGIETIRNRLKEIERQLKPAFNDGVMNHNHFNNLESWVRNWIQQFRV